MTLDDIKAWSALFLLGLLPLSFLGRRPESLKMSLELQPFRSLNESRAVQPIAHHRTADATLSRKEHIHVSAHVLRHTLLRKAARKHGVEYAKELAGHTSDRYIWRYVQPSDAEKEEAVDNLF